MYESKRQGTRRKRAQRVITGFTRTGTIIGSDDLGGEERGLLKDQEKRVLEQKSKESKC